MFLVALGLAAVLWVFRDPARGAILSVWSMLRGQATVADHVAQYGPAARARHRERNILGDRVTERSYVTEPVSRSGLAEPGFANRYVESVVAALTEGNRGLRAR